MNYLNVKQPNQKGKCPVNSFLCDEEPTTEEKKKYGICVEDDQQAKEEKSPEEYKEYMVSQNCPITGIQFKKDVMPSTSSHVYATQFNDHYYIQFSKKSTRLPLTQFRIDLDTPCIKFPSALSVSSTKKNIFQWNEFNIE